MGDYFFHKFRSRTGEGNGPIARRVGSISFVFEDRTNKSREPDGRTASMKKKLRKEDGEGQSDRRIALLEHDVVDPIGTSRGTRREF